MLVREMEIVNIALKDAFVIRPKHFKDDRGDFYKLWTSQILETAGVGGHFDEEYISISRKGVLRGLHYQTGSLSQAKFVTCLSGRVQDVVVDLRRSSPTYSRWASVVLSAKELMTIYVPRGFAHGFMALTNNAIMNYKADNIYSPEHEAGIRWNDNYLEIKWKKIERVHVSDKDNGWPDFENVSTFP